MKAKLKGGSVLDDGEVDELSKEEEDECPECGYPENECECEEME